MVGISHGKEAGKPSFVPSAFRVGATGQLIVRNPALGIFAFRANVHHQWVAFFLLLRAFSAIAFGMFVFSVHLYFVHRVCRQVMQGYTGVTTKKSRPLTSKLDTNSPFTVIFPFSSSFTPGSARISPSSIEPSCIRNAAALYSMVSPFVTINMREAVTVASLKSVSVRSGKYIQVWA